MGGGGVWAYLTARYNSKATIASSQADLGAMLTAQTKLILLEQAKDRRLLKRRVDRQDVELRTLSKAVAECTTKHANCENNLAECRNDLAFMQAQIAIMMKDDKVATYPNGGANPHD